MKIIRSLLSLILLIAISAASAEQMPQYIENEWNYVDGSIDPSAGIPEDAKGKLAKILNAGVLRVATEPYYPPQEFIDPSKEGQDQYVGSDMELARLIAARMGVTLEIVPMDFSQVLLAVDDEICDMAISGLAFTPGRAVMVTLSKGYHYTNGNASTGLLINVANRERISSTDDLRNKDIVAQSGSLQELLLSERVYDYHKFRRVETIQEVYDAIESGKEVAATVDIETAQTYIENHPNLMLVPGVYFSLDEQFDGDRIAVKKGEYQLMYFINGVIDEVLESGQYEEWFVEYGRLWEKIGK